MAVNFCSPNLKTKINSVAVSCEGYDLSNLLSSDPLQRGKGFLAEGFTKPPISVFLNFFCNIDISHILIWTEVGSQKSNGLELLIIPGSRAVEEKSNLDNSSSNCAGSGIKIGSCKLNNEPGLAFRKYNYRVAPVIPLNFLVKHFYTSSANVLRNTNALEIKIFSTANSSVPALKKIEVWGHPSRSCTENTKQLIFNLWNQTNSKLSKPLKNSTDGKNSEDNEKKAKCSLKSADSESEPLIPDEFLDPITCNIMAIPMTLPSGKVVDVSTLDKCTSLESTWGRCPSDPFTGIPFTKSIFAVPDTALKSRIDQFLLENGHLEHLRGVGRTVGQSHRNYSNLLNICDEKNDSVDKQIKAHCSSSQPSNNPSNQSTSKIKKEIIIDDDDDQVIPETTNRNSQLEVVKYDFDGADKIENNNGVKRKNCESEKFSSGLVFKKSKDSSNLTNHEVILEDSLDCAIGFVLSGLPSFLKTSVEARDSEHKTNQGNCCSNCQSLQCLFSLPCTHLLCRNCLVNVSSRKIESMNCGICNHSYKTVDVKRFHVL